MQTVPLASSASYALRYTSNVSSGSKNKSPNFKKNPDSTFDLTSFFEFYETTGKMKDTIQETETQSVLNTWDVVAIVCYFTLILGVGISVSF